MIRSKVDTFQRAVWECLIIAVGVLVALAANNWNEARQERIQELEFLSGIALDLEFNIEEINSVEDLGAINKAALLEIIESVRSGVAGSKSAEQFVEDLIRSTYLNLPFISSITFDELRSSGSMSLVGNESFRRELADYYRDFDAQAQFHEEYRRKEAAAEEALLGFLPLQERMEYSDSGTVARTDIDPAAVIKALQARPDLVARLEDMVWVQNRMMTRYSRLIRRSQELLDDIGAMR